MVSGNAAILFGVALLASGFSSSSVDAVRASLGLAGFKGTEVGMQRHERGYEDRDGDLACTTQDHSNGIVPLKGSIHSTSERNCLENS